MVSQVSAPEVVHHEVEILAVLEGAFHVDQKRMAELTEYLALVKNGLYVIFLYDSTL